MHLTWCKKKKKKKLWERFSVQSSYDEIWENRDRSWDTYSEDDEFLRDENTTLVVMHRTGQPMVITPRMNRLSHLPCVKVTEPSINCLIYKNTRLTFQAHTLPTPNSGCSTVHPLANYVSYDKFSHTHKCFLMVINKHDEPKFFSQAVKVPHQQEAMKKEIDALEANETWDLEYLSPGKHTIDSKWIYKIKYKPTWEVERYKARLIAIDFVYTI